jgi:gliding motility associated protien GldN
MKNKMLLLLILISVIICNSQSYNPKPSSSKDKEIISYQYVKEGGLHWMKRVTREIYVDEKINQVFQYNKKSLFSILKNAIATGDLQAYSNDTIYPEELEKNISKEDVEKIMCKIEEFEGIDPNSFEPIIIPVPKCIEAKDITKFRIMEDWYFDKNTSSMKVHIISIAPIMNVYSTENMYLGTTAMYWLNFDQLRNILIEYPVFNRANDDALFTWDDLFLARTFNSLVIKESNAFDRKIAEYNTGIDALLEADRVEQVLFETEHDVWSY